MSFNSSKSIEEMGTNELRVEILFYEKTLNSFANRENCEKPIKAIKSHLEKLNTLLAEAKLTNLLTGE